jgi:small-conductance mechanosensitive channel
VLAVGFAAQNMIRDYLHGFFIIMEDWYRVGEVAVIAGIGGLVVEVSLRRTVLRDLDGAMHVIPNSKIELASNLTRDWARSNLNVEVAYGVDLDRVTEAVNAVGEEMKADAVFGPDLLSTPHVEWIDKLGESGIKIPWPHAKVYFGNAPSSNTAEEPTESS